MLDPALAAIIQSAAVKLRDVPLGVGDRHDHAAVQVLMPAFPVEAQTCQPRPDVRPGGAVFQRQPQPQRAVGKADPQPPQHRLILQTTPCQILPRRGPRRRIHQPFVIIIHDLVHQRPILRRKIQRRFQPRHRAFLHPVRRRGKTRARRQQFERMTEAHPVKALHELNHIARRPAPHAVEDPLPRRHHERSRRFLMKRATPDQVPAPVRLQLHAPAAHQRRQINGHLDPFDFLLGNARHG